MKKTKQLPFLTIQQAADVLGHNSTSNVRTWLKQGILRPFDANVKVNGVTFPVSKINDKLVCRKSVRERQLMFAVFVDYASTEEREFKNVAEASKEFGISRVKIERSIEKDSYVSHKGVDYFFYRKTIKDESN